MKIRNVVLLVAAALTMAQGGDWQLASPDFTWEFPRDHWSHPEYKTEWWYFTGHLQTQDTGRRFGYQFTFFRVGITPDRPNLPSKWTASNVLMGHAALIDESGDQHVFSEVLYRDAEPLGGFNPPPNPLIAWSRGPPGTDTTWTLFWNGTGFDISATDDALGIGMTLRTRPEKALVLQGPNGYSAKERNGGGASLYYSFTRLATDGQITLNGETWDVSGLSWMDREFGSNQLGAEQVGWDWFSVQLDDGRDVMLYLLRTEAGVDYAQGTLVSPTGEVEFLDQGEWKVDVLGESRSPHTAATYPSHWQIALPDDTLEVVPIVSDQENVSALVENLYYWEGAVIVRRRGQDVGRGFVELTGYGRGSRPAI